MAKPDPNMYAFRGEMVERLRADLVGPSTEEEVIDEFPLDRYIVGVLWPGGLGPQVDTPEEPDPVEGAETDGVEDSPVAQSLMRYPSSAGITFTVDTSRSNQVTLRCEAARYVQIEATADAEPAVVRSRSRRSTPGLWKREVQSLEPVVVDLRVAGKEPERTLVDGLALYVLVRPPRDGEVTVTAALVNRNPPNRGSRDASSWFQVGITASTEVPAFVDRSRTEAHGRDDDLDSSALLYRNSHAFAAGHGCSAEWDDDRTGYSREVRTTFMPAQRLLRATPAQFGVDLRMSTLATKSASALRDELTALLTLYGGWIGRMRADISAGTLGDETLVAVAERHVRQAEEAARRIGAGIHLLKEGSDELRAFQTMNEAMQLQRARQVWIRSGAAGRPGDGSDARWYPFQLAFILLNLPGLADPGHPDREIADLLWFPTGGGKTEAYLGLVAFTVSLRRIRDSAATGVAVIMRYTLRLLTIQQFERASMLICALESLRRHPGAGLGDRPFSIGLWVGAAATPNTLEAARRALKKLDRNEDVEEGNPVQLLRCPWCGTPLDVQHYRVVGQPVEHMRIACGEATCEYRDGLPVHLVDEDVYRERPELLIGTVDKFARLSWTDQARRLLGRTGTDERPDLIIQDELHLISGPLGSMVGLYETAVDAACTISTADPFADADHRPKVVASTATIRRAERQVRAVFDRSARQFPPPGLVPDQNFFAEPAASNELGDRLYVGLMAPGTSHQTLMIRVYASLLQSGKDIDAPSDAVRDPYWTLVGYFNSLRVLGSAELQVQDDVRSRLRLLARRTGTEKDARSLSEISELTSRVPARSIPVRLQQLERDLSKGDVDDVVLATNMISVGVDVDRLGLMAVMGQPQSTAEYIQATSRVGRQHPGLVVTILNAARSRDRSHFENFISYHQTIYRSVEATSATPFAARARDRGLHGVLVATARALFDDLAPDIGAEIAVDRRDELERVVQLIVERAKSSSDDDTAAATREQVQKLVDRWVDEAAARGGLRYRNSKNLEASLLVDASQQLTDDEMPEFGTDDVPWPTLQSLRDVDAESGLRLQPKE